eukprot:TRINITY_DN20444_c0_g3_i1.p1 TRINITY_DN20444_c0_g3~~TRINITY_DN20444_c0_g3_i1.p1  ORF type:complete len:916 (+),score=186.19 TRINITY_DN20444_c0_g3_i1:428-3175(+)
MDSLEAYKISSCITKGQISEVYRAVHVETGLQVALKRIKIYDMPAATRRECETEIGLLQSLDHAHLIKYHAHFVHDGELYVVMEHAAGGTLAQRVEAARKSGVPLEEKVVWRWLYDVVSALAYLHRRRVLHRDVKPSHIFLGEDGQAKLGDFGLSKAMSAQTQCAFSCVGTPFYMSPERVRGDGYSFGSDVWSLGCSLYEMAMGYPPFFRQDMDFYALGDAICSARYQPLPREAWSREFIDLVAGILTVDPGQRPDAQRILDLAGCRVCGDDATRRIRDFRVMGTIGRGKFSEVHRSLWKQGGDVEVALKRVQIFDMDTEARRECNAEVNLLKSLHHSTIIKYLDSFIEGSELIIVLELASHGDLAHLCRQLKMDERSLQENHIWAVFLQVCDALCYMHENRVMHRDIKPANIFLCRQGVVKLGDLGLGRYFSSNTYRAHSVVGTPFYMSPEVISNNDGYSFKSDIWSLGCVLYELSALTSPFAASRLNYYALGTMIQRGEYTPLPDGSSPRVRSLVSDMIQVKRDARPGASSVLEAARRHSAQAAAAQGALAAEPPLAEALARAAATVNGILSRDSPRAAAPALAPALAPTPALAQSGRGPCAASGAAAVAGCGAYVASAAAAPNAVSASAVAPAPASLAPTSAAAAAGGDLHHLHSSPPSAVVPSPPLYFAPAPLAPVPATGAIMPPHLATSLGEPTVRRRPVPVVPVLDGPVPGAHERPAYPAIKRTHALPPALTPRDAVAAASSSSSVGGGAPGGAYAGSCAGAVPRRPLEAVARRGPAPSGSMSARATSRDRDRSQRHSVVRRATSPTSQVSPLRLAGQLAGQLGIGAVGGAYSSTVNGACGGGCGAGGASVPALPESLRPIAGLPPIAQRSLEQHFAAERGVVGGYSSNFGSSQANAADAFRLPGPAAH